MTWATCMDVAAQDSLISLIRRINAQPTALTNRFEGSKIIGPATTPIALNSSQLPAYRLQSQSFRPGTTQRSQDANCVDSSFLKVFQADNRSYSFYSSAKTADGGIIIGGFGRNKLEGPPYTWYSVVTKFDSTGHHIWSKELRSDVLAGEGLYIESVSVFSDGSILVSGEYVNPLSIVPPTVNRDFFIAKLTAGGSLVWLKTLHSLMGNGTCTTSNIRYAWTAEGTNGDIYLAGTIPNCPEPRFLFVMKMNSAGDIVWQYSLNGHFAASYCMGVFYDGNYITVVNRGDGTLQYGISVDLVRLDATTGAYISHKSWEPNLPYPDNFFAGMLTWTPTVVRLINGHYCVYGETIGNFANFQSHDVPQFSVIEFDTSYNYVKGYTIHSSLNANTYECKIKVDRFGRVLYGITVDLTYPDRVKYYGIADNGLILHQRKKEYDGLEGFYDNAELFDDGSAVYINNFASLGQDYFYLYYAQMHISDTGGQCLGTIENFSYTSPINYIPNNFSWTSPTPNPTITTLNQNNNVVDLNYTAPTPCFEKSFCDTLKIHGIASSCNYQQSFSFSAYKNRECGTRVNWSIDPTVILSSQIVNDTTFQFQLNQPWQGWLHAELFTSCGKVKDSIYITISDSPGAVNIGPDTTICPGNTITINAHRGYASYLWSNASTDSMLVVNSPGTYYVDVSDACGNSFSDTVIVAAAPPIPFDIGQDKTKCNNDTLHLDAPAGFLNYTWGPPYNISSQTGQQVVVQPLIDTSYFVRAEKTPGCYAYDTIKIKVFASPVISLGSDKSFCQGDSAILNAGGGFSQYQWSNGMSSQIITVKSAGNYSIIGTTVQGCKSYDTLGILNVWPNPVVTLDHNSELCTGDSRVLTAGNFNSYLWQDGSTSPSFTVSGTGIYYVAVADNHQCHGSDTTRITSLLPLPAGFLPTDTSICNYGSFLIKPITSFSNYLWNTGARSASISVTVPGTYWLQATDTKNCMGRDSILIKPKDCLTGFYIPTAFTPDHNGRNDDFKPFIGGIVRQYQFTIYNRWGQVVFKSKDLYKGWDGTLSGIAQDANVYAWTCTYQLEGESIKKEKGVVTLIR